VYTTVEKLNGKVCFQNRELGANPRLCRSGNILVIRRQLSAIR